MLLLCPAPNSAQAGSPNRPATWRWARSADGTTLEASGVLSDEELATSPLRAPCWLVIPHQWLSWHRVTLPAGRAARSAAALAGLLEEKLLGAYNDWHLAVDPDAAASRSAGPAWVAAMDANHLRRCVDSLLERGWHVLGILPEVVPDRSWRLWAHEDEAGTLVTVSGPNGVLTVPASANLIQELGLPSEGWAHAAAEPAVFGAVTTLLPTLPWHMQARAQQWLYVSGTGWNLAQHEWRHRLGSRWWQRQAQDIAARWRAPHSWPLRWGLAVNALLPLVAVPLLAAVAAAEERALQRQIRQVAQAALPGTPVVLDPRRQIETALRREQARTGTLPPSPLEQVLNAWAGHADAVAVRAIRWNGRALEIETHEPLPADTLAAQLPPNRFRIFVDGTRWHIEPAVNIGQP